MSSNAEGKEFLNVYDGATAQWKGWEPVGHGEGTTNLPLAATVFNGKLYLFGVGAFAPGGNAGEFVNVYDGSAWKGWEPVGHGEGTTNLPLATTVFNGKLYLFGVGAFAPGGNAGEFVNVYDGSAWKGWEPVGHGEGTTNLPLAATVFNGKLYLFGVGAFAPGGNAGEFVNVYDGSAWKGWEPVGHGEGTTNLPLAATVFNGKLYLFGVGAFAPGGNAGEFVNVYDGSAWKGWEPVGHGEGTTNLPLAATVFNGKLYLSGVGAFGPGGEGGEFVNVYDGSAWKGWEPVGHGEGTTTLPLAATVFDGKLYLFGVSAFGVSGSSSGEGFDTKCIGIVQFCRNYHYSSGNKVYDGGWRPCGACVGFKF